MVDPKAVVWVLVIFYASCVQMNWAFPYVDAPDGFIIGNVGPGFEGDDMRFTPEQLAKIKDRKATIDVSKYWPEVSGLPDVPYRFDDNLVDQPAVENAINHWKDHTCLTFTKLTATTSANHIYFQRSSSGCNSFVGMSGGGGQPINIPVWCEQSFGTLVHEIGHAIGFWHEQSRSDRDDYVIVNYVNIETAAQFNFDKQHEDSHGVPYDYASTMHYYGRGFSTNGKITLATTDPLYQGVIGQRNGLSHMDKLLANIIYSCIDKNLVACGMSLDPCQNFGYTDKMCNCICPPGTTGWNCETVNTPYSETYLSSFSEEISAEGQIANPLYPSNTPGGEKYSKFITAPNCKLVQLTFNEFTMYPATQSGSNTICDYEGLEIRTGDPFDGDWYCGTDITAGEKFTSQANQMTLYAITIGGYSTAKWQGTLDFIHDPGCGPPPPTPPPSSVECDSTPGNKGGMVVTSPSFPQPYPDDYECYYEVLEDSAKYVYVYFGKIDLGPGDQLTLENQFEPSMTRNTAKPRKMRLPVPFKITFTSDGSGTGRGFSLIIKEITSKCYMTLHTDSPSTVSTPRFPRKHGRRTICQWKITAPQGMRVELDLDIVSVRCNFNHVSVNTDPQGTATFDSNAVTDLCGDGITQTMTSVSNEMSVLYISKIKGKGMSFTFTAV